MLLINIKKNKIEETNKEKNVKIILLIDFIIRKELTNFKNYIIIIEFKASFIHETVLFLNIFSLL